LKFPPSNHRGIKLTLATLAAAIALSGAPTDAGEATLHRDSWGVPHIWADGFASAGYAVGQAQCEDSLDNVLYCLHAGVGRLSELLGDKMLATDMKVRKLRHGVFAERDWPNLCRPVRELTEGYCAGVNDYIDSHPDEVSVPVNKVTPVQVVAWQRSLLMRSAVALSIADAEASKSDGYHPVYNPKNTGTESTDHGTEARHPGIPPGGI
jgi:acyl-homoserine lactone acylase PvdQ